MNTFAFLKNTKNDVPALTAGVLTRNEDAGFTLEVALGNGGVKTLHVTESEVTVFTADAIGDMFENKVCNWCGRYLPTSSFMINQTRANGTKVRRPSCEDCRSEIEGLPIPAKERRRILESNPLMKVTTCNICSKSTIPGLTSKYVIDHNHKTGKIRGWLCDSCNTGLGRFQDDAKVMLEGVVYLLKHDKPELLDDPEVVEAVRLLKSKI